MAQPSEDKHRRVTDPLALRAMAHPLRLKLIGLVGIDGTLTATQAAAALDSTPAVTAYHLRTLAEYGFVGDAGSGAAVAADRSGRLVLLERR
jgi:helix-turn-helix protein